MPQLDYPRDRLLPFKAVFPAEQITNPSSSLQHHDSIRRIIKRGGATKTTVGTLSRYKSYIRRYFSTGIFETLEVPILSHEHDTLGCFAKEGDSGAAIVTPSGEIVAMLIGGTASRHSNRDADIAYATPFEWIWDAVREESRRSSLVQIWTSTIFKDSPPRLELTLTL